MTRIEMLDWIYRFISVRKEAIPYTELLEKIGDKYYRELEIMHFITRTFKDGKWYVWLSRLGKDYCSEIFDY